MSRPRPHRARHRAGDPRHCAHRRAPRTRPARPRVAALSVGAVVGALVLPIAVHPSVASWADAEFVRAHAAALDCATPDAGTAQARSQLLGGTLLGLDLDGVAEVWGVRAESNGETTTPTPDDAVVVPGSDDTAYQDPLTVTALGAITLPLGNLLRLPLDTDTGVYNQYARADHTAGSAGASGLVTDSGGIDLGPLHAPKEERPEFGTLHLGSLLEAGLGSALSDIVTTGVTDLELGIGAVAGSAVLDGCGAAWTGDVYEALDRDYAIAGLDLGIGSPLVGDLVTGLDAVLGDLEADVAALAGDQSVLNGILGGVVGLVSGLLGSLGLGTPTVELALTIDLAAARGLLTETITDGNGIVELDLDGGTIGVDLAALLGEAYGGDGLNGLAPNTQLLIDAPVLAALEDAVTDAVAGLVDDLVLVVERALDLVRVEATVHLPILSGLLLSLGVLDVTVDASLASLLDGSAVVGVELIEDDGLLCLLNVCALLNTLVSGVTGITQGLAAAIGGVVSGALATLGEGLDATLDAAVDEPLGDLLGLLDATLGVLLGPDGVLSLTVNAQNDPDPAAIGASPELPSWTGIPGEPSTTAAGFATGRYDIAALVLGVVGAIDAVELVLARASVGANTVG